jgi:hypothetical protein
MLRCLQKQTGLPSLHRVSSLNMCQVLCVFGVHGDAGRLLQVWKHGNMMNCCFAGDTSVICGVFGPMSAKTPRQENAERMAVEITVKPMTGTPSEWC